jgi:chromosome segregation ATPase
MDRLYQDMAALSSRQAATQSQQLQSNHEMALMSLQIHHETAAFSMNGLSHSIIILQDQLDNASDRLQNLDQGLAHLNKTVDDLETATQGLKTAIDSSTRLFQMLALIASWLSHPMLCLAVVATAVGVWITSRRLAGYLFVCSGMLQ